MTFASTASSQHIPLYLYPITAVSKIQIAPSKMVVSKKQQNPLTLPSTQHEGYFAASSYGVTHFGESFLSCTYLVPIINQRSKDMGIAAERINQKLPSQHALVTQIIKLLDEIKFGSIEIIIHDGKVTLIERKEKIKPTIAN
ncbi:MAG: YezD family protein [Methylococcaceae bacterium]